MQSPGAKGPLAFLSRWGLGTSSSFWCKGGVKNENKDTTGQYTKATFFHYPVIIVCTTWEYIKDEITT